MGDYILIPYTIHIYLNGEEVEEKKDEFILSFSELFETS